MVQFIFKFSLIAVLVFASGNLALAQEDQSPSDRDINAERKALTDSLSKTIEKLQELGNEESDGDSNQPEKEFSKQLLRILHQHDPNLFRLTRLRGSSFDQRWFDDSLGRYSRVNDQFTALAQLATDAIQPSPFWIGVQCESVESYELLVGESRLVTVNGGMKVNAVTDGSPALKAGISTDDIIVFFNDQPVNEIGQLVMAIGANKDQLAEISLVRDQEIVKTKLSPALREMEVVDQTVPGKKTESTERAFSFFMDLESSPNSLPEEYEAVVRCKRGEPVTVKVLKGNNSWEATSDNAAELPENIQGFVAQVLASTSPLVEPGAAVADFLAGQPNAAGRRMQDLAHPRNTDRQFWYFVAAQKDSTDKLEDIQKKLEELQKAVDELKGK